MKKVLNIVKFFIPHGLVELNRQRIRYNKIQKENLNKEHHFDVILSVGNACRPAFYLKKHGLRIFANPLDWMMSYKLDTVVQLFQSKFSDFFIDVKKDERIKDGFVDVKNNVTSMHYPSIGKNKTAFNQRMRRRFKRLDKKLRKCNNICFISGRKMDRKKLIKFLTEMGTIYSGEITLINIRHNEHIDGIIKPMICNKEIVSDRLQFIEYEFNDVHKDGDDSKTNLSAWQGNNLLWKKIVKNIAIKTDFISFVRNN